MDTVSTSTPAPHMHRREIEDASEYYPTFGCSPGHLTVCGKRDKTEVGYFDMHRIYVEGGHRTKFKLVTTPTGGSMDCVKPLDVIDTVQLSPDTRIVHMQEENALANGGIVRVRSTDILVPEGRVCTVFTFDCPK